MFPFCFIIISRRETGSCLLRCDDDDDAMLYSHENCTHDDDDDCDNFEMMMIIIIITRWLPRALFLSSKHKRYGEWNENENEVGGGSRRTRLLWAVERERKRLFFMVRP